MSADGVQVVVEVDASNAPVRIGTVVAKGEKGAVEVEWPDGAREHVRAGSRGGRSFFVVPLGGLSYLRLVDRDAVIALIREMPADAFVMALAGVDKPQTSSALIDRLAAFVTREEASAAWKRARTTFEAAPAVVKGKNKPVTYRWRPADDDLPPLTTPPQPVATAVSRTGIALAEATATQTSAQAPVTIDSIPVGTPPAESPVAPRNELVSAGDVNQAAAAAARRRPLSAVLGFAELPDEVRSQFARSAPPDLRFLVGMGMADTSTDRDEPSDPYNDVLLSAAVDELRTAASDESRKPIAAVFLRWVDAVLARPAAGLALDTAEKLAYGLRLSGSPEKRSDALLGRVADVVARQGNVDTLPDGWSGPFRTLAAGLPLRPKGGRFRLIRAVGLRQPNMLRDPSWWSGVTFDDLAAALSAPLPPAMRAAIEGPVLARLAATALADARSRRRLLTIMAAPTDLAAALNPRDIAHAWRHAAAADPAMTEWDRAIRQPETLTAALAERDRLAAALDAARTESNDARRSAEDLAERAAAYEALLRDAERSTSELREGQARQIRIDSVRAMAELAAYVEGTMDRQPPDRIVARVRAMAARQSLVPVGEVDATVAYQPGIHDLVGPALEPGTVVLVRRVGYTWRTGGEETVLVRALVEPASRDEGAL